MQSIQGLHHITAVSSNPQSNINFYHHFLGKGTQSFTENYRDSQRKAEKGFEGLNIYDV